MSLAMSVCVIVSVCACTYTHLCLMLWPKEPRSYRGAKVKAVPQEASLCRFLLQEQYQLSYKTVDLNLFPLCSQATRGCACSCLRSWAELMDGPAGCWTIHLMVLRVTHKHKGRQINWQPVCEVTMNLEKQQTVRTVAARGG